MPSRALARLSLQVILIRFGGDAYLGLQCRASFKDRPVSLQPVVIPYQHFKSFSVPSLHNST